jgi:hypothetical protein
MEQYVPPTSNISKAWNAAKEAFSSERRRNAKKDAAQAQNE